MNSTHYVENIWGYLFYMKLIEVSQLQIGLKTMSYVVEHYKILADKIEFNL